MFKRGGFTLKLASILAVFSLVMVLTVFVRRIVKQRWFALRDDSRLEWAQVLDAAMRSGILPDRKPRMSSRIEMRAAEVVLLERWSSAEKSAQPFLYLLFQHWGLLHLRLDRLRHGDKWEQARSALILGRIGCKEAIPDLLSLLDSTAETAFIQALAYLGEPAMVAPLMELLASEKGKHRSQLVVLALISCARQRPEALLPYLENQCPRLRETAATVLAEVASADEADALIRAAADPEPEVRAKVARALSRAKAGGPRAVAALQKLATDMVWYVRLQAVAALGQMQPAGEGETFLRASLLKAMEDDNWRVREKAALGLYALEEDARKLFAVAGPIPCAHDVLVSALDREGLTWKSLDGLASADAETKKKSRALVLYLLKSARVATIFSALEFHPQALVRKELAGLVDQNARPDILRRCAELLSARPREDGSVADGPL